MRNIKVTIQYEGLNYHGFQVQGGLPTVQMVLEDAVEKLTGERARVTGAGRTDAGVHARGQVINFATRSRIPCERFPHALNSVLPGDIVALRAEEVGSEFDACRSATSKSYTYTYWNCEFESPFWRRYSLWVPGRLDIDSMEGAVREFMGCHDFASFRATGGSACTTKRTVFDSRLSSEGAGPEGFPGGRRLVFMVEADGFLYNMVRIMAGTILQVGLGRMDVVDVRRALDTPDRNLAGPTLPAHGLCLEEVRYNGPRSCAFP